MYISHFFLQEETTVHIAKMLKVSGLKTNSDSLILSFCVGEDFLSACEENFISVLYQKAGEYLFLKQCYLLDKN